MRTDFISEIDTCGKGHWWPGIFAIEQVASGKRHYVGTANVGRRVRDNLNWLDIGSHPNSELQNEWKADPDKFRIVLVQKVPAKGSVKIVKQAWLDKDRNGSVSIYNRKNAVAKTIPRSMG